MPYGPSGSSSVSASPSPYIHSSASIMSSSGLSSSSIKAAPRRRHKAKASVPTGLSMGLEEEVEFGSDEDTIDQVGEIEPETQGQVWYPGKVSPPKKGNTPLPPTSYGHRRTGSGSSKASTSVGNLSLSSLRSSSSLAPIKKSSSKPSLLGRMRRSDKDKSLGESRLVLPESFNPTNPSDSSSTDRTSIGTSTQYSVPSSPISQFSSTPSMASLQSKKEKPRPSVMGRFFGGKRDEYGISDRTLGGGLGSVESLSVRSEASSAPRSILITPAHIPPAHNPLHGYLPPAESSVPSSPLPRIPTTPFQFNSHEEEQNVFDTHGAKPGPSHASKPSQSSSRAGDGDNVDNFSQDRESADVPASVSENHDTSTTATDPSLADQNMAIAQVASDNDVQSDALVHFLLPSFPTIPTAIEGISILSTTVMRRLVSGAHKKSGSLGSGFKGSGVGLPAISSSNGPKKYIWIKHLLVLTSFHVNGEETNPSTKVVGASGQTIAHVHLFGYAPPSTSAKRPGSAGVENGGMTGVGAEVDREAIQADTAVGVWEGDEYNGGGGRRWVLRINSSAMAEEWLCDMPNGDTLFDWMSQLKGLVSVIKTEAAVKPSAVNQKHLPTPEKRAKALIAAPHPTPSSITSSTPAGVDQTPRSTQSGTDTSINNPETPTTDPFSMSSARDLQRVQNAHLSPRIITTEHPGNTDGQSLSDPLAFLTLESKSQSHPPRKSSFAKGRSGSQPPSRTASHDEPAMPETPSMLPLDQERVPARGPAAGSGRGSSSSSSGSNGLQPPTLPPPTMPLPMPPTASSSISAVPREKAPGISVQVHDTPRNRYDDNRTDSVDGSECTLTATSDKRTMMPVAGAISRIYDDDASSVSGSVASSRRRERRLNKVQAVDLMAEVNSRPELNYEINDGMDKSERIIEDRPRRIRFVG